LFLVLADHQDTISLCTNEKSVVCNAQIDAVRVALEPPEGELEAER
jgi:hypothetical protein